ncbi:MAG: hypothetical protein P8L66_13260 [Rhodospirillaceae bacterium]|nr:hypothetical protein [Rhodospirillaceae bacterium]
MSNIIETISDVISDHSGMHVGGDLGFVIYRPAKISATGNLSTTWTDISYMSAFFGVTAAQTLA